MTRFKKYIFIAFSVFGIVFLLALSSCSQYKEKPVELPEKLIPKQEFIKIMIDVRMIETIIRQDISKGGKVKKLTPYYYTYLFDKYNIDKEQFTSNIIYYASMPDEMADINEQVVETLSQLESEVKEQKNIEMSEEEDD